MKSVAVNAPCACGRIASIALAVCEIEEATTGKEFAFERWVSYSHGSGHFGSFGFCLERLVAGWRVVSLKRIGVLLFCRCVAG